MAWFMAAAPYIAAAGTVVSAYQQEQQGILAAAQANMRAQQMEVQAEQLNKNAKAAEAASQREAIRAKRESSYLASRNKALAAAGGGSASDPTVVNLIDQIESEGEYNALTALYNGSARAQGIRSDALTTQYGAEMERQAGKSAKKAGKTTAFNTVLSGASNYGMARYG